jgi:methanogenic corrinoid protein MtbC1
MTKELVAAISEMREEDAMRLVQQMLDREEDPSQILEACREAMVIVGEKFETCEYFLPELMLAGDMLGQISAQVKPRMADSDVQGKKLGKFLMGTVAGDIHDIGKDIVVFMLDVNGFEVRDLGVDVPAEKFVEAIKEFQPEIVGLSGFLTLAYDSMKSTVKAIEDAGLRDQVKIIIGGGQIDDTIRSYTGADAYGKDAMAGVTLSKQFVGVS